MILKIFGFFGFIYGIMLVSGGLVVFEGYDDAEYIAEALLFLQEFPRVGDTHWSIRYPLIAPVAVAIEAFGFGEFAIVMAPAAAAVTLMAVTYAGVAATWSPLHGAMVVAALLTVPVVFKSAHLVTPDIFEMTLSACAFWMVRLAVTPEAVGAVVAPRGWRAPGLAFAAGLLCAAGVLMRETGVAAAGFLFVYIAAAAGSGRALAAFVMAGLAAAAIEFGYMWAAAGDPLYRLTVSLGHTRIPSNWLEGDVFLGSPLFYPIELASRWRDGGLLGGPWWLNPYSTLTLSTGSALIAPAGAVAVLWLRRRGMPVRAARLLRDLYLLGALSFVISFYALTLPPDARYVMPLIYALAVTVGMALAELARSSRLALALAVAALLASGATFRMINAHDRAARLELARHILAEDLAVTFLARGDPVEKYLRLGGRGDLVLEPDTAARLVYCTSFGPGFVNCPHSAEQWTEIWARRSNAQVACARLAEMVGRPGACERLTTRSISGNVYPRLLALKAINADMQDE